MGALTRKTGFFCLLFSAVGLFPLVWAGFTAAGETGCKAWIEIKGGGPGLEIVPYCLAPEDSLIEYRLVSKKRGGSGTSSSTQSGSVRLKAGQPKPLCRVGLNFQAGNEYLLHLRIYKDGRMVAEERKSFSDSTLELRS